MENFDIELTPGNMKAAMKEAGAGSGDLWGVPIGALHVLPGFNIRIRNAAYEARVRWIANSIKQNGFYKDKPITGFVAVEDGVQRIYIIGGHRRYEALLLAISEGFEIDEVPVIIKPRGTNMEDLTVDLYVGNEGDGITTYEHALLCQRLVGMGRDSAYIASRMDVSSKHVDNLLLLASAPSKIRNWVANDIMSATTAIEALAQHKDKAVAVLQKLVDKQNGKRVTPKSLPAATFKAEVKRRAPEFHSTLTKVQQDPGFSALSEEVRNQLTELLSGLPEVK